MRLRSVLAGFSLLLSGANSPASAAQHDVPPPTPRAPAAAAFQAVRVGDGQMACDALAAEINLLTIETASAQTEAQAQADKTERSRRAAAENTSMMKHAALGGLVHASAFIPFGGGFAALAARSAAMGAASAAVTSQTGQLQALAPSAGSTPQAQRLAHLEAIFQRKTC